MDPPLNGEGPDMTKQSFIAFATYIRLEEMGRDAKEVLRSMLVVTGDTEEEARANMLDHIGGLARPELPDDDEFYEPENFYIVIREFLPTEGVVLGDVWEGRAE